MSSKKKKSKAAEKSAEVVATMVAPSAPAATISSDDSVAPTAQTEVKSTETKVKTETKDNSEKEKSDEPTPIDFAKLSPEQQEAMKDKIVQTWKSMKSQVQQIATKIAELDGERAEHALVLKTIKPLDPARRCFRLVGGVLVERTIKEVIPAVEQNLAGIDDVIGKLTEQLKKRQVATNEFQQQYNIRTVDSDHKEAARELLDDAKRDPSSSAAGSEAPGGVLVS